MDTPTTTATKNAATVSSSVAAPLSVMIVVTGVWSVSESPRFSVNASFR